VLLDLSDESLPLTAHADGLIAAAHRATQSMLDLSRSAASAEELLLVRALTEVRRRCSARGYLSLRLAPPETLQFLRDVPSPVVVGEPRLSDLQQVLLSRVWQMGQLPAPEPAASPAAPVLYRLPGLEAELAACAAWCLTQLRADPAARLLVVSACTEPSVAIQGELLWRNLADAGENSDELRKRTLAVEGGATLSRVGVVGDALLALRCLEPELDTDHLYALLRSPYFDFGSQAELWSLQGFFEKWAQARWSEARLRAALAGIAEHAPAAQRVLNWLELLRKSMRTPRLRTAGEWARGFSELLAAAGFNQRRGQDSREHQRFERWAELLDEFAGLDAVLAPLSAREALGRLQQLAAAGRHQASSADAAVTLTAAFTDPLVDYDGIWVLGLAESRWPAPPRPDSYVALQEQRAHHWPEASVTGQRARAQWILGRWQQRTARLVLSYPEREGDLRHRPTGLLGVPTAAWCSTSALPASPALGLAAVETDQQFAALDPATLTRPLAGGAERLRVQQDCPFRAQAQWRLGAKAAETLSDGLSAAARGTLLHLLLQRLWEELSDQAGLLALAPAAERAMLERHWHAVLETGAVPGSLWWPPALRERERERTLAVLAEVLQQERVRAPFTVLERELKLQWPASGPRLNLRIDRVDRTAEGSHVLIDYKSGAADRMKLHEHELQPLQLALYVAALSARGQAVQAAALFSLKPGEAGLVGVTDAESVQMPGLKPIADWDGMTAHWQQRLMQLIAAHLAGDGTLASDRNACRQCHLPALCRRAAEDEMEPADE
jgi:ATP-dependent helicase/nuclease subunit B